MNYKMKSIRHNISTMSNRNNFKDKVVLITGSSSGIGEGIAIHLCGLGASVTITGRNEARLKQVGIKCKAASPDAQVLEVIADVSQEADAKLLLDKTISQYGRLDILVNNAGIYQVASILDDNYMSYYDELYRVNVKSVVYLTKLAIPFLIKSKGNIVNVSSVASYKPGPLNTLYAMTKSSIDMFTKCMALELAPKGIRVNAINPAAIRTPIFNKVDNSDLSTDKMVELTRKQYPLGRIGETKDCATAVAYLASDDASFITGVCLLVDGGSVYTSLIMPEN